MDAVPAADTTGGRLGAPTIVIQYTTVRTSRFLEYGAPPPYAQSMGHGTAVVLRDGKASTVTWSRRNGNVGTTFTSPQGERMIFAKGQVRVLLTARPGERAACRMPVTWRAGALRTRHAAVRRLTLSAENLWLITCRLTGITRQRPGAAMTSTTDIDQPLERAHLAAFGYQQELHRRVGGFASFAAGFSFVSILTTVFQLFFLGYGFGGAAFFWTWPIVFGGQLLVALNFSTLAARFPISGAIFQWSSRLAGSTFGWFTGWVMIIGQILTVAAAAIALQAVLPSIWTGFQVVGGSAANSSPTSPTGAQNAVILGVILLAITTTINIIGIRLMSIVNSTGVVLELLGVTAIIITLFAHAKRGPAVLVHTTGAAPTPGSPYIWAFLASGLMAAYVMVGFDSAGELSEETHAPRNLTPRTIIRALAVSGVGGALLLISALMAAPSLTDGNLATVGMPYVVESAFGLVAGRIMLVDVVIAICVCTLACQTSGSRMMFSMARQRALPCHRILGRVDPRTGTPIVTSIVVGAGAAIALIVNLPQPAVFTALSSLCIAMLYLGYLGVTGPLLLHRIRAARGHGSAATAEGVDEHGKRLFSLGKWGIPVTVIAVVYQVLAVINLIWPRKSVYDLTGHTWWLQWSAPLFIGLTLVIGYLAHQRLRTGTATIEDARLAPVLAAEVAEEGAA